MVREIVPENRVPIGVVVKGRRDNFKSRRIRTVDRVAEEKKKTGKPTVIKWNGVEMIRNQSIVGMINTILSSLEQMDLVKLTIVGNPSTGKTELMKLIFHYIHTMSKRTFAVKILSREDLKNFETIIKNLNPHINHCLGFDDVSFLSTDMGKKEMDKLQRLFTEVRHMRPGLDQKIFIITASHYLKALPPYIRQADYYAFTSIGPEDASNVLDEMGRKFRRSIRKFQRIHSQAFLKKRFSIRLGKKGIFWYETSNPFRPVHFWTATRSHVFVFPTLDWVDPNCLVCNSKIKLENPQTILEKMDKKVASKFGPQTIKSSLMIMAFAQGKNLFEARRSRCMTYISKKIGDNNRVNNFMTFLDFYGIEERKTRMPHFKQDE